MSDFLSVIMISYDQPCLSIPAPVRCKLMVSLSASSLVPVCMGPCVHTNSKCSEIHHRGECGASYAAAGATDHQPPLVAAASVQINFGIVYYVGDQSKDYKELKCGAQ